MENRIITETPQVIELKKLLKEAVDTLKTYSIPHEIYYTVDPRGKVETISFNTRPAKEFLDKIKEVEL